MKFLNFNSEPSKIKRSIWNVVEADAAADPAVAAAESAKTSSKVVEEWHRLREALMMVLRRFPEAKEAVLKAFETPLAEGLAVERKSFYFLFSTEDQKEGMHAFLEKRRGVFKGR